MNSRSPWTPNSRPYSYQTGRFTRKRPFRKLPLMAQWNSGDITPFFTLWNSGDIVEFGGHNTVFHTGGFRGFPGLPLLRSRPVSLSTVVTKAPSPAGRPVRVACRSFFIGPSSADCRNFSQSVTSPGSVRPVTRASSPESPSDQTRPSSELNTRRQP